MLSQQSSNVRQKRASSIKATENIKKAGSKRKSEEYEVESIISHAVKNGEIIYTVTWVGYPGERTELSEDDLKNSQELLQEYKRKLSSCGSEEIKTSSQDSVSRSENDEMCPTIMENGSERLPSSSMAKHVGRDGVVDDTVGNTAKATIKKTKEKTNESMSHVLMPNGNTSVKPPNKRSRKAKYEIAPDAQLGYTNGCIVDTYKGFSNNYPEPVVLVSYKEPLPCGFESKQDEIVPIRLIAEADPQRLITHLVGLLSTGRLKTAV